MRRDAIIVSTYMKRLDTDMVKHNEIAERIKDIVSRTIDAPSDLYIDVYNMDADYGDHLVGEKNKRVVILNFFSNKVGGKSQEYGYNEKYGVVLYPVGDGIVIYDKDNFPLAEYRETTDGSSVTSQLNILVNAFKNSEDLSLFGEIMNKFDEKIISKIRNANSWGMTSDKKSLINMISGQLDRDKSRRIERYRETMDNAKRRVEEYKRYIVDETRKFNTSMAELDRELNTESSAGDKIAKDLDLLIQHEKIKDIIIKDRDIIEVKTNTLSIFDEDNTEYYGGEFTISVNINNSKVLFFNDEGWKGYWTNNDPHPHVSGDGGYACLGNVASTIAELCAQYEIYALGLICIDFLESVNTSDPAGRNVKRYWDIIDENGERQPNNNKHMAYCDRCEESVHEEDLVLVYDRVEIYASGDIETHNERLVCEYCRDEYAEYDEDADILAFEIEYYDDEDDEEECF